MANNRFLESLLISKSVSGFEDEALAIFEEYLKPYSSVFRDNLNNCYAFINSSSSSSIRITISSANSLSTNKSQ